MGVDLIRVLYICIILYIIHLYIHLLEIYYKTYKNK